VLKQVTLCFLIVLTCTLSYADGALGWSSKSEWWVKLALVLLESAPIWAWALYFKVFD
jgi:hypothetical protein